MLLLAFFAYTWFNERPPIPYYVMKPADEHQTPLADTRSSNEVIANFKNMSLEQLVAKLNNAQLVENGYTQRDLALGCLTSFHHFNLNRALHGLPQADQQRVLSPHGIIVYPSLSELQFQAIIQYANAERWPYTSKGIFLLIKKPEFQNEASLEEAFLLTPEFGAAETLFSRSDNGIDKKELLTLLKEGDWQELFEFTEQQRMSQDLSSLRRQKFLMDYITKNSSPTASLLLLKMEPEFAHKKLDDQTVIAMLKAMPQKTPESEKFALNMLTSPRSDAVWQQAALRLYEYAGESAPQPHNRNAALTRFAPHALVQTTTPKAAPAAQPVKITNANIAEKPKVDVPKNIAGKSQAPKEKSKPVVAAAEPIKAKTTPIVKKQNEVGKAKASVTSAKPAKEIGKAKEASKGTHVVTAKPVIKKDRLYIVQDGDTLWKISKRYNIEIEVLRQHNRLASDALKPGSAIRIPS